MKTKKRGNGLSGVKVRNTEVVRPAGSERTQSSAKEYR